MKQKRYKFLKEGLRSQSQGLQWELNKWQKAKGELKMCENGFHCSEQPYDAFSYVQGEILAEVEVKGKHLSDDDKECWEEMRIIKTWKWQKNDSVLFSIFAAKMVIKNYEDIYPTDKRPREAIEASEAYQRCPCENHARAAGSARSAAASAESAAWSARSARSARGAASAAWGAASAAWSAAGAARAARSAERRAAGSAESAVISKCNKWMKSHIKKLERIQKSLRE